MSLVRSSMNSGNPSARSAIAVIAPAGDGMPATQPIDHRQRIVAIEHQKSHLRNIQPVPPVVGMLGPCGNEGKHRQVRGGVHHHSQ